MTDITTVTPLFDYLKVAGIAMLPVFELKGAIPIGVLTLHIPLWTTFFIAWAGAAIPVPFILLFIKAIIHKMQKSKITFFNRFSNRLMGKVHKHQDKLKKYAYWALFVFVAIPLPGTGVWTGSLIAAMLDLRIKYSLPMILLGNLVAGLAMLFVTHSINLIV